MDYKEYVIFRLADESYGLDINNVENIERLTDITIVPFTKPFVEGVINLRGNIIPVVNGRKRLNLENKDINKDSRIIIIKYEELTVGLLVDSSSEVIQINDVDVEVAPKVSGSDIEFVENIGKDNGRIIMLVNIGKLLDIGSEE